MRGNSLRYASPSDRYYPFLPTLSSMSVGIGSCPPAGIGLAAVGARLQTLPQEAGFEEGQDWLGSARCVRPRLRLNTTAVKNADGAVTFTFMQKCNEGDLNCLAVPARPFDVTARYYLPSEDIISGRWTMPKPTLLRE